MSSIRIKNFGPIKEGYQENGGWIDVKKVTVFIGNQGSGKSTVAKLISTLSWAEKAMVKGVMRKDWLNTFNRFKKQCGYHNITGYFKDNTEIEYKGEAFSYTFRDSRFDATKSENNGYELPKIMYVPAERNFVAAIEEAHKVKYLPSSLVTFLDEYRRALKKLKEELSLPINNASLVVANGIPYIKGVDYEIPLSEASSGFQASVPLFLVSKDLAGTVSEGADPSMRELSSQEMKKLREDIERILLNDKLAQEVKDESLRVLSSKIKIDCFINVVEEPEQNLFPISQRKMLNALVEFNNMNAGNKLVATTHSPYFINYLSLAVKAFFVSGKIKDSGKEDLSKKLNEIVPLKAMVNPADLVIYELDDKGNIIKLKDYKGLPSDDNYLNERLAETNYLFDDLLQIEKECQ